MAAADTLRDGAQSPGARLLPGNRPELADRLAGASTESIDKFIIHCRAEANLHLCSTLEIKNGDQESEFRRGQACAYGEMTNAITSRGASFGLSPGAQAVILEYLACESGGEIGSGDPSGHGNLPREYYEKGMERAYRHVVYQFEKACAVLRGLENLKSAVRLSNAGCDGGISRLFI